MMSHRLWSKCLLFKTESISTTKQAVHYRIQPSILLHHRNSKKLRKVLLRASGGGRFLNDKGHALTLFLIVKRQAANISIWVCFFALLYFIQDLRWIIGSKHWQLPHSPIPPIIIPWHFAILPVHISHLIKFKARDPSLFEHVVNLLRNWIIRERWEVGEGLKLFVIDWIPCLHASSFWTVWEGFAAPCNGILNWKQSFRYGF